jgi:hypothetical protein
VSNLDPAPEAITLTPGLVRAVDVVEARKTAIGDGTEVRRLLPQRTLRTMGAWCFLDHYGPEAASPRRRRRSWRRCAAPSWASRRLSPPPTQSPSGP